ncbi:MAG: NAD-dependent epimerase/dehydratase family protein, partial [Chloroflexota bacterium]|nr:NAD-dependent epimerase/dehydratase family protein [Chloroflexota bacterium]
MRCVVTGAAGFIGSHLCTALLAAGHEVAGVDAFIPYYPRATKERNLVHARRDSRFAFHDIDLRADDAAPLVTVLRGAETVFHLAAMGGLLASWTAFDGYLTCNVQATQRLLEAIRLAGGVRRLVHASTSSVYGDYVIGPETTTPRPVSPYGITKLAGEHLVQTYDRQFDVPATVLRLFSVYGPHQRPDMGYYQFVDRLLTERPITVYGDGTQRRGNTYVGDIVRAFLLADERFQRGTVYNVGGAE